MTSPDGTPTAPVVAVFDLDGTLARGRSLLRFGRRLAGWPHLLGAAACGASAACAQRSRTAFKGSSLRRVLQGRALVDVERCGQAFAEHVVANRLDPAAVERVRAHRAAGDELVLVTAALDAYARPVADALGFADVIATRAEVRRGVCTGRLLDADLRGERKVELLEAWLGERAGSVVVVAYGNSADDEPLLEHAAATQRRAGVRPLAAPGAAHV
jgi:phosphatidylglycerophosphatase C